MIIAYYHWALCVLYCIACLCAAATEGEERRRNGVAAATHNEKKAGEG